uniref:FBD domain-containing protein n=1 Tax=Tetradesmus obliquus TaxID=3088 RepID=A0A383WK29_TETOB|eukprot:jgi/Sobl393_1/19067/SZX77808.1
MGRQFETVGQLQLAHLTALTQLQLLESLAELRKWDQQCVLEPAEQLPPNLRVLSLYHSKDPASHSHGSNGSLQPLLPLSGLQEFRLFMRGGAPAAAELAALSSISSLTKVELEYDWDDWRPPHVCAQLAEAVALEWPTLPVKALYWTSFRMSAAVVQQAGALQGLTSLELWTDCGDFDDGLVPARLAAMLQPLTGLRRLLLACVDVLAWEEEESQEEGEEGEEGEAGDEQEEEEGYECAATAALMQAVGGLRELADVNVRLQMHLSEAAVQELCRLKQQLLPGWMEQVFALNARLLVINRLIDRSDSDSDSDLE